MIKRRRGKGKAVPMKSHVWSHSCCSMLCVSVLLSLSLSISLTGTHSHKLTYTLMHSPTHMLTQAHTPGCRLADIPCSQKQNLASFLKLCHCWPSRLDMILSGLLPPPSTVPTHPWARTRTHTQNSHYPWLLVPLWPPILEHRWGPTLGTHTILGFQVLSDLPPMSTDKDKNPHSELTHSRASGLTLLPVYEAFLSQLFKLQNLSVKSTFPVCQNLICLSTI